MSEPFPMQFSCPGCGAVLEAMSNNAGAVVLCPYCNASMAVPDMKDMPTLAEAPAPLAPPSPPPPKPGKEQEADRKYYVRKRKKEYGPFSSRELRKLARSGKLAPTDLIWKKGFRDWKLAAKARGLFIDPK